MCVWFLSFSAVRMYSFSHRPSLSFELKWVLHSDWSRYVILTGYATRCGPWASQLDESARWASVARKLLQEAVDSASAPGPRAGPGGGNSWENALSANTKFVLPSNGELVNIIGDMAGILPLGRPAVSASPSRPLSATADSSSRSLGGNHGP